MDIDDGLGEPRADVRAAAVLVQPEPIETQPRGHGDQPPQRVTDFVQVRLVELDEDLLGDVFSVGEGAHHSVADVEHALSMLRPRDFDGRGSGVGVRRCRCHW